MGLWTLLIQMHCNVGESPVVVNNNMWTTIRLNLRQNRLITFKKGNVNSSKRNPLKNQFLSVRDEGNKEVNLERTEYNM